MLAENSWWSFCLSLLVGRTRVPCYHPRSWPLIFCVSDVPSFLNLRVLEFMVPSVYRRSFSYAHDLFLYIKQVSAYTGLLPSSERLWLTTLSHLYSITAFIFHLSYITIAWAFFFFFCSLFFVPLGIEARALGMLGKQCTTESSHKLLNLLLSHLLFSTFFITFPLECSLKDREELL